MTWPIARCVDLLQALTVALCFLRIVWVPNRVMWLSTPSASQWQHVSFFLLISMGRQIYLDSYSTGRHLLCREQAQASNEQPATTSQAYAVQWWWKQHMECPDICPEISVSSAS